MKKLILPLALLAAFAAGAETVSFGTGSIRISFNDASDGYGIRHIYNCLKAETPFVNPVQSGADFWLLEFHAKGADGQIEKATLDNRAPSKRQVVQKGDRIAFKWEGLSLPGESGAVDVLAGVKLAEDGVSADWTIKVVNRSAKWALFETHYPCLKNVVRDGEADALVPWKQLGMRLKKNFKPSEWENLECFNPWWRPSLVAFVKGGKGLFVYARDGECRYKKLMVLKGGDVRYDTIVENAGIVGKAESSPKFPVRTTVFAGDWWEVARIYRGWALQQKWATEKGPIAKRSDFPSIICDTTASMVVNGGGGVTNLCKQLRARWPKAKIGFDWSQWQCVPFDSTYPEMLPSLKGVPEACAFGKTIDFMMKPYTNGRLWNKSLASWAYAEADATKKEDGKAYDEQYSKWHFAVMCPGSKKWREIFVANALNVVDTLGCNALYVDQVSCSRALPCFDPTHGHPVGGGSYWADGCREMLRELHGKLAPRGVSISSEGAGEAYMGLIDGYDLASETHPEDVPFYTAVYGGYAIYNGSEVGWETRLDFPAFFASQVRALLWGCALYTRWYYNWPMSEKNNRLSDSWVALAELRGAHPDFFVRGHLVGDAVLNEPQPTLSFKWDTHYGPADRRYEAKFPAVWGTVFANADESRFAVALANLTDKEQTVSFKKPFVGKATLKPYSAALVEK